MSALAPASPVGPTALGSSEPGESFWAPLLRQVGEDFEGLERRLATALRTASLVFQPVVWARTGRVFGHEAFLRTGEPSFDGPEGVLRAAGQLGLRHEVGRLVRRQLAEALAREPTLSQGVAFLNLRATDLIDPHLHAREAALSRLAARVVLELRDGPDLLRVPDLERRVGGLRQIGYRIALEETEGADNFPSLDRLEADLVRINRANIRDLAHSEVQKHRVARTVARASARGCLVVAGYVETANERGALRALGVDLIQGYFVGHPVALPSGLAGKVP